MNIWFICPNAGSRIHGMNYRIYQYAHELVKLGHNVRIFSGTWSHQFVEFPKSDRIFNHEIIDGIKYVWVKVNSYASSSSLKRIWSWFQFIRRLFLFNLKSVEQPDSVVVSSPIPYTIFNGFKIRKKTGAKLIFEVRDLWPLSLSEIGGYKSWHPLIWCTKFVEKQAYSKSDAVISVLSNSEKYIRQNGLGNGNYEFVPNGADFENTEKANIEFSIGAIIENFRMKYPFILAYTGSFNESNAIDTLMDLIISKKNDPSFGFLLVGPESSGKEKVKVQIATEQLEHILLLPSVKKSEVHEVLKFTDIGYIGYASSVITKHGISPTKIYDYIMAKIPVLLLADIQENRFSSFQSVFCMNLGNQKLITTKLEEISQIDRKALKKECETSYNLLSKESDLRVLAKNYGSFLQKIQGSEKKRESPK